MPGSFMQLAAFGLQDLYLVEEPQMTYWKVLYFQHTNFSIESIQHTFKGANDFGNLISCTIPKDNGDLMGKSYISAHITKVNKTIPIREWTWVNKIKNPSNFEDIYSQSVKISPDGTYAIITGFFSGQIEYNNVIIGDSLLSSIFVLKVDAISGEFIWIKTAFNNNNEDTGMNFMDVIILNDNSIYLTGYFHNIINFDNTQLISDSIPNNYNSFIVKLSNDGNIWSNIVHIKSTENCITKSMLYINKKLYIAGDFSLDLSINTLSLVCNEKTNGFIFCLDNTISWLKQIRGLDNNTNSYVKISTISSNIESSSIVINGYFALQANFDNLTLDSNGRCDVYIAKIALDGAFVWVNQIGGNFSEIPNTGFTYYNNKSIKVLTNNNIVLTGVFFSNTINFNNSNIILQGDGNKNTFIAQLSYDNNWLWAIKIDNPGNYINTCPSSIFASDFDNSIMISGSFGNPSYQIGNTTLINYDANTGTSDTYITKISKEGNIIWAISIGGSNSDFPANLDISPDGSYVVLIGYFDSLSMYIGDFTLDNNSLQTYTYIVKLDILTLPILNRVGFQILNYVELRIGGKTIDKQYSNWMYIWSELSHNNDMKQLLDKMVGTYNDELTEYTVNIPLFFSYCRHYGLAIPLISLQYHEVELYVNLENKEILFGFGSTATIDSINLWVDYYFLDTKERKEFAEQSHDYLIETIQYQEEYIKNNYTTQVKLDFNHPIKFLTWGIKTNSSNTFDYTDNNESCFVEGQLLINNRERFEIKPFNYFNYIQPYQHFKVLPKLGINVYSFALEPTKLEPTGSCNFSMINRPDFNIKTSPNGNKLIIYALNYNILKIKDGMGGLAFVN